MIELPFKPFNLSEVSLITRCPTKALEVWAETRLNMVHGSGAVGLEWMPTFAVYVGARYLEEGAPGDTAGQVVGFVARYTLETLEKELARGYNFACPEMSTLVEAPLNLPLGRRLRLDKLLAEFKARLKELYP